MTTIKETIKNNLSDNGLELGCWDEKLELLNDKDLKQVMDNMMWEQDTDVTINKKLYVVEISIVDAEVDFSVLTQEEYIDRYGDERWN